MRLSSILLGLLLALPCLPSRADEPSLQQMIGQMLMVGFVGTNPKAEGYRTVLQQAFEGKIGGVIYLGRNIRSLNTVRQMNKGLQGMSSGRPLFIAIDQEGGRIERLTSDVGFKEIPSAAAISRNLDPEAAGEVYQNLAAQLAILGFNLNLGPVVDLNINPDNPIVGRLDRSYSRDPVKVASYARAFVEGHRGRGVLTSLKHFPGHGSSVADTHKDAADVTDTWDEAELWPYRSLIASGHADMIMSSHIINRRLSGGVVAPASLSRAVLVDLLRETMGFKGIVITDDLQMGAVTDDREFDESVKAAVLAGNDILVFANDKSPDPHVPEKVANVLALEAEDNPKMLERIRSAYENILKLKAGL